MIKYSPRIWNILYFYTAFYETMKIMYEGKYKKYVLINCQKSVEEGIPFYRFKEHSSLTHNVLTSWSGEKGIMLRVLAVKKRHIIFPLFASRRDWSVTEDTSKWHLKINISTLYMKNGKCWNRFKNKSVLSEYISK